MLVMLVMLAMLVLLVLLLVGVGVRVRDVCRRYKSVCLQALLLVRAATFELPDGGVCPLQQGAAA